MLRYYGFCPTYQVLVGDRRILPVAMGLRTSTIVVVVASVR